MEDGWEMIKKAVLERFWGCFDCQKALSFAHAHAYIVIIYIKNTTKRLKKPQNEHYLKFDLEKTV